MVSALPRGVKRDTAPGAQPQVSRRCSVQQHCSAACHLPTAPGPEHAYLSAVKPSCGSALHAASFGACSLKYTCDLPWARRPVF